MRLKGLLEPIVVADGSIYVGAGSPDERSGGVYALDAATGEQSWQVTTVSPVRATPAVAKGVVYVAEMGGTVHALAAATGEVQQARAVASRDLMASQALTGGVLYLARGAIYSDAAPTGRGTVYALDAASGSPRWEVSISPAGVISSPLVANGVLYVGCDDGRVYALGRLEGTATAATAASRQRLASRRGRPRDAPARRTRRRAAVGGAAEPDSANRGGTSDQHPVVGCFPITADPIGVLAKGLRTPGSDQPLIDIPAIRSGPIEFVWHTGAVRSRRAPQAT